MCIKKLSGLSIEEKLTKMSFKNHIATDKKNKEHFHKPGIKKISFWRKALCHFSLAFLILTIVLILIYTF